MKNRMHELCSFGSVRDEGREALVYSEILHAGLHVGQYRNGMNWLTYLWSTRNGYMNT
jgi:hypothetical protein